MPGVGAHTADRTRLEQLAAEEKEKEKEKGPDAAWMSAEALEHGYGVKIVAPSGAFLVHELTGAYHGNAPSPGQMRAALPLISSALLRYPPAFIRAIPIETIVVCSSLHLNGRRIAGLAANDTNTILLSVGACGAEDVSSERIASLSSMLHHEVFHLVERRAARERIDHAWALTNPPGFEYPPDRHPMPDVAPPGFVTPYATASAQEDRAELFAASMTDMPGLLERARSDRILRDKLLLLLGLVETLFTDTLLPEPVWAGLGQLRAPR